MDVVFLDANVLFSAAYMPGSGLRGLWRRRNTRLVTSSYAAEEAWRNLDTNLQRSRLARLLERMLVIATEPVVDEITSLALPPKDRPILSAAISAGATHLLTGDKRHFGPYFGKRVAGVVILPPALYLESGQR